MKKDLTPDEKIIVLTKTSEIYNATKEGWKKNFSITKVILDVIEDEYGIACNRDDEWSNVIYFIPEFKSYVLPNPMDIPIYTMIEIVIEIAITSGTLIDNYSRVKIIQHAISIFNRERKHGNYICKLLHNGLLCSIKDDFRKNNGIHIPQSMEKMINKKLEIFNYKLHYYFLICRYFPELERYRPLPVKMAENFDFGWFGDPSVKKNQMTRYMVLQQLLVDVLKFPNEYFTVKDSQEIIDGIKRERPV
jgi:hypothetical protein